MTGLELEITLTIAAAAALLNIWIAQRVGRARGIAKVSVGDGGHELLTRRMRAHANYVEYTPFFLILLALIELARGPVIWLWAVSIVYVLGRILHVFGMDGAHRLRMIGTITTMAVLLALAIWAILIAYLDVGFAGAPAPALPEA
ncbi:MAG: MAPEG family protein [Sphingomonadaceae bacterium]|nr:MAPEG family protein [Sphingomonadaceae bacterium]